MGMHGGDVGADVHASLDEAGGVQHQPGDPLHLAAIRTSHGRAPPSHSSYPSPPLAIRRSPFGNVKAVLNAIDHTEGGEASGQGSGSDATEDAAKRPLPFVRGPGF